MIKVKYFDELTPNIRQIFIYLKHLVSKIKNLTELFVFKTHGNINSIN